ncbi:MAG: DNA-3-methyladenine glycosylase I [Spirochaetota bacterium]
MDRDDPHRVYHDHEYGFPIADDNELFGRLILEINQAGLSWTTILKKQENFRAAYAGYDVAAIARFSETQRARLLADAGIIRNRLKVDAAIHNAARVLELQAEYGSFKAWLDANYPLTRDEWVKLFRKTFRFTGGEITNEFLLSTGYLRGAHVDTCPVFTRIAALEPPWIVGS